MTKARNLQDLEIGFGSVSLKVFLAIANYLACSADDILCKEVNVARPVVHNWLTELAADYNQTEIKIIADTIASLVQTLRKNKTTE